MTKATSYYVLETVNDVEPFLHGPFETDGDRDRHARQLRHADDGAENGLFHLSARELAGEIVLTVGPYSGGFFHA